MRSSQHHAAWRVEGSFELDCMHSLIVLELIYAGSGLPRGPFQKTISTPLKWVKSGFAEIPNGFKVGWKVGFDPLLTPLLHPKTPSWTHFSPLTETYLKPTLSGNKLFSKKGPEAALTQHKNWFGFQLHLDLQLHWHFSKYFWSEFPGWNLVSELIAGV